jgi:methionine synthase II (cobalamin-independent)
MTARRACVAEVKLVNGNLAEQRERIAEATRKVRVVLGRGKVTSEVATHWILVAQSCISAEVALKGTPDHAELARRIAREDASQTSGLGAISIFQCLAKLHAASPKTNWILGVVTTKHDSVEDVAYIESRIKEAAKYCPLAQLGVTSGCGFGTFKTGQQQISDATQWGKLKVIVDAAVRIWGSA